MNSASHRHLAASPLWRRGAACLSLMLLGATGACSANSVTILSPQALREGSGPAGRAAIVVGVASPTAMRTQSREPVAEANITFWKIELIRDQGSSPANSYSDATLSAGSHIMQTAYLDGPAPGTASGAMVDALNARQLAFTNVPAGSYRVRVKAHMEASTPGSQARNDGDTYFTDNSGWEISENTATVTNGSSIVTYTAPDASRLAINVNLHDGLGDTVNTAVSVVSGRPATDAGIAPTDLAIDATIMHDFTMTVGGVTSTFVWIPRFNAFQLINPANCGTTNRFGTLDNARPPGYWVGTVPSGAVGTDYRGGQFGGFYVGKYEASRADATNSAAGSSTDLSSRQGVVPWTNVDWAQASNACLAYHPNCRLIGDDDWATLAIYAQINDLTPKGNNNNGDDIGTGNPFTDDPTLAGTNRALTGTGGTDTSHTMAPGGVYDLNGNVGEWTSTISKRLSMPFWFLDGFDTTISWPSAGAYYVDGQDTTPLLGRLGVPVLNAGTANATYGNDQVYFDATSGPKRLIRGGMYSNGAGAGLWCVVGTQDITTSDDSTGFRPVLRF